LDTKTKIQTRDSSTVKMLSKGASSFQTWCTEVQVEPLFRCVCVVKFVDGYFWHSFPIFETVH